MITKDVSDSYQQIYSIAAIIFNHPVYCFSLNPFNASHSRTHVL